MTEKAHGPPTEPPKARRLELLPVLGGIAIVAWLLGDVINVLLLAFAGLLGGLFLSGVGGFVAERTRMGHRVSVALFCLVLVGVTVTAFAIVAPEVGRQVDDLGRRLPEAFEKASTRLEEYDWGRRLLERLGNVDSMVSGRRALEHAGGILSSTIGALASVLVLVFVGLFVALEPDFYRDGVVRLVPRAYRLRTREVLGRTAHVLRLWMLGKMAAMVVVGLSTWLGLFLLGVPLSLTLALLAALLTFVPNFGPVLSAVPAVLLGFLQSPAQAAYVVVLYLAIQTVESYVLTPLVQRQTVSLPPALTIVAQVTMGTLAGGIGVVVATPLTAALLVFAKHFYVEDILERE